MPVLVKGDDVRSGPKVNSRHGRHRSQWVNRVWQTFRANQSETNRACNLEASPQIVLACHWPRNEKPTKTHHVKLLLTCLSL